MHFFLGIIVHTANILGIFNDPFEFEGDYGPEMNPTREIVFERVVSKAALTKHLSDEQIRDLMQDLSASIENVQAYRYDLLSQAIKREKEYGPTLSQIVTPELIQFLKQEHSEWESVGFQKTDLQPILNFIDRYGSQKVFHFFRNSPPELLHLDKALKDLASRNGENFDLPILGSTGFLKGQTNLEFKINLLEDLLTHKVYTLTQPAEKIKKSLQKINKDFLRQFLSKDADSSDLEVFCSPLGQVIFYWIYQALNLDLTCSDKAMVDQINCVKELFALTLGNATARAAVLKERLGIANSEVLFTQESDAILTRLLTKEQLFHSVDAQNPRDGTLIFLHRDFWDPNYEVISIEDYEGFHNGQINVILATRKDSHQRFLLASCHGHSTKAEDGRRQIALIMKKFHELSDGHLQLIIGTDANTKTPEDVKLFREQLEQLGLTATNVGPTTIKRRMVSVQHGKVGRWAMDEEDYLIILNPEQGGRFKFDQVTVGFSDEKPDLTRPLPNVHNLSDHYPIGAILRGL